MCTSTHVSLYGLRQFSVISSLQTGIIAAAGPGMRTAPSRLRRSRPNGCCSAAALCRTTAARTFILLRFGFTVVLRPQMYAQVFTI